MSNEHSIGTLNFGGIRDNATTTRFDFKLGGTPPPSKVFGEDITKDRLPGDFCPPDDDYQGEFPQPDPKAVSVVDYHAG